MQSQVFFFISSIGFIILGILSAIILAYIWHALYLFSKILKKMEKDINSMGDITKEMLEDIRDSSVFQFLFKGKKRKINH
jgi:uncharacterized protein YoxC